MFAFLGYTLSLFTLVILNQAAFFFEVMLFLSRYNVSGAPNNM